MKSGSGAFFFGGDAFTAASPAPFFCESAVCSRVESRGQSRNRSRSPWLTEASLVEDLKTRNQVKRKARSSAKKEKLGSKDSRSIETKVGESSLLCSRRRSIVQRLGENGGIVVIARRQAGIGGVLRILDNICTYGMFLLRRRP
jgi:hypothetical protein